MRRLPEKTMNRILEYKKLGWSVSKIANKIGVSKSTVNNYSKEAGLSNQKNKGGRPKKLSYEISGIIKRNFSKNKLKNLSEGREMIQKKFNVDCSRQTIKNYLNSNGLKCFIKTKKPLLSADNKKKKVFIRRKKFKFYFFRLEEHNME
jgi:transposase